MDHKPPISASHRPSLTEHNEEPSSGSFGGNPLKDTWDHMVRPPSSSGAAAGGPGLNGHSAGAGPGLPTGPGSPQARAPHRPGLPTGPGSPQARAPHRPGLPTGPGSPQARARGPPQSCTAQPQSLFYGASPSSLLLGLDPALGGKSTDAGTSGFDFGAG
uniref:Uncharacterized protein n=1 Tax=Knipowitschia caucasica TaxID=637954 RepID=A0AAV2K5Y1_KNICA